MFDYWSTKEKLLRDYYFQYAIESSNRVLLINMWSKLNDYSFSFDLKYIKYNQA